MMTSAKRILVCTRVRGAVNTRHHHAFFTAPEKADHFKLVKTCGDGPIVGVVTRPLQFSLTCVKSLSTSFSLVLMFA